VRGTIQLVRTTSTTLLLMLVPAGCGSGGKLATSPTDGGALDAPDAPSLHDSAPMLDTGPDQDASTPVDASVDVTPPAPCTTSSDCPSAGTCISGRCLVTIAKGQSAPYPLVVESANVVWGNQAVFNGGSYVSLGSIVEAPVSGGAPTTLVSGVANGDVPEPALVASATDAYWPNGGVVRTPLAGGQSLVYGSGQTDVWAMAIDAHRVYWTNGGYVPGMNPPLFAQVLAMPLGGGTIATLTSLTGYSSAAIAVDSQNLYWVDSCYGGCQVPGLVLRMPLAGGAVETLASFPGGYGPFQIALDATHLYMSTMASGTSDIAAMPLGGGSPQTLVANVTLRAMAVDATSLYWTDDVNGTVMKVSLSGGAPATLYQGDIPYAIAVDDTSVYWTSPSGGTVMKLSPK
jgi:hypothetical protein